MNFEQPNQALPEEIIVEVEEIKVNAEGKKYLTEKDGVFYGGDYLSEVPGEITMDENFPPAPEEKEPIVL